MCNLDDVLRKSKEEWSRQGYSIENSTTKFLDLTTGDVDKAKMQSTNVMIWVVSSLPLPYSITCA